MSQATPPQRRILLAGASGSVGQEILRLLKQDNAYVRTLSRDPGRARHLKELADDVRLADATRAETLAGLCDGIDVVISALGASVALSLSQRASYKAIDEVANLNLLHEAQRAGVRRFAYIAAESGDGWSHTAYIQAHEAVVKALKETELTWLILRPTGIYTALDDFIKFARLGLAPVIGRGESKTNPIHPTDVAEACVSHLWEDPQEISLGGPEIMTRRDIAAKAFEALGKTPRIIPMPAWLFRLNSFLLRWLHPRLSQLMAFVVAVSTHDAVAPQLGQRRLADYYEKKCKET